MQTTTTTRLTGVLAHPVAEAALALNHFNGMAQAAAADVACLAFDVQPRNVAATVTAMQSLGARGVYLTGRLRTAASTAVDYLSDEAHGTGAINTIVIKGDTRTGHNTEALAIGAALEPYRQQLAGGAAIILGSGAMAAAAAYVVVRRLRMAHVAIADRNPDRAQVLRQLFATPQTDARIESHELFPPDIAPLLAESRLIINATTVGGLSNPAETPITIPDVFSPRQIVLDVVYDPPHTALLADAGKAGATVLNGDDILKAQLSEAYRLMMIED